MKRFKNLFGGKKKDDPEVKRLVNSFSQPSQEPEGMVEVGWEQYGQIMESMKAPTPEAKASLAARLAFRRKHAIDQDDIKLYQEYEADANKVQGRTVFWCFQAIDILKAEPGISEDELAARVLQWAVQEGRT